MNKILKLSEARSARPPAALATPGRSLSESQSPQGPPRSRRPLILAIVHGDRFVEIFSDSDIDLHVAAVPLMTTPDAELKAEKWLDKTLPNRYADIFLPGYRRRAFNVEPITPHQILARIERREQLRKLDEIADRLRKRGLIG